jgi:hypothetical protein
MKLNGKERKKSSRLAAAELLRGIVTGTADVYESYRQLYGIWCHSNAAVQELRPLFRIVGVEPDGRLSVSLDFERKVQLLAVPALESLHD